MNAYKLIFLIPLLMFSGCHSIPKADMIGLGSFIVFPAPSETKDISINEDFEFVQIGALAIAGNKYKFFKGKYQVFGADDHGIYYINDGKGILRNANLGMRESGGIFIPHDSSNRCSLWIIPKGTDLFIPGAGVMSFSANEGTAYKLVHIPLDRIDELMKLIKYETIEEQVRMRRRKE